MTAAPLDLVIKNVRLVRPGKPAVEAMDLGVKDGRFVAVQAEIPATDAREIFDARGLLGFPGLVDAHTHAGIYSPLAEDAITESKAAVSGGVTAMLTYFRTGQYYLNRGGAYRDFFPEVLRQSAGRYWCDYAYHVAPIERAHIDEMEMLAVEHGVPSFKIFMFYGGYGLHGSADPAAQRRFLMLSEDESYDLAHFEFVMRGAARLMLAGIVLLTGARVADVLKRANRRRWRPGSSIPISARFGFTSRMDLPSRIPAALFPISCRASKSIWTPCSENNPEVETGLTIRHRGR
jgi:dihydroorotase-like cyclic amidohydrolase